MEVSKVAILFINLVVSLKIYNINILVTLDYSVDEFDGIWYLMHQVRRMPNGYRELRSRFFLDSNNHVNAQLGHDPAVHCNVEMTRKFEVFYWIG